MSLYNHPAAKSRRRLLRRNSTDAERILWSKLRNRQLLGVKFFRQYSVGPFILDFYAPTHRFGIELDGAQHLETKQAAYDQRRADFLHGLEINIIRFWNNDVLKNIEGTIEQVASALTANPS